MQSAYLYSGTYTNMLTSQLLSANQRELLLGARSIEDVRTALLDTPIAPFLQQGEDVRTGTARFAVAQKERLLALAPDTTVLSILFLHYDYANIKQILLGIQASDTQADILSRCSHLGTIAPPVLYEAVRTDRLATLSPELARAYEDGLQLKHDEVLGDVFDSAYLTHAYTITQKKYRRSFVERYIQIRINHHNIRTRLRVFTHPETEHTIIIKSRFVPGGTITEDRLCNLEITLETLARLSNGREWKEALELFVAHKDFSGIDKALDNQFMRFLKTESIDIHAPISLFAFFHTVLENVQFIDAVIAAQKAGLNADTLRSIIRTSFLEYGF